MLFDIFYHLIKCHHVMTQYFWEDVMSDVRCEMNGEEAYWGCVDSRLKVGCWANRKLAGVTSLPAHLWTSTEIFCHLVMQWSVLHHCRLWQIIVSFVIWKGNMSTSKWFDQVWSVCIWQFPKVVVDCQEHHPLGDVGFHLHWLAFWFPALPWSHSRWQLRPVVKASMPHSISQPWTAQRFTGPELDFYAWGNDFFRSMIKWRHAKVEAESFRVIERDWKVKDILKDAMTKLMEFFHAHGVGIFSC